MKLNLYVVQVLIRLVGADEHMYTNYTEAMHWIQDTDVLEMIVDKFSSSVCDSFYIFVRLNIHATLWDYFYYIYYCYFS